MTKYSKISDLIHEITISNQRTSKKIKWINIFTPKKDEIEFLRKKFKFDLAQLKLSFSNYSSQRAIINKNKNYLFLIIHFPYFDNDSIKAAEILFFVTRSHIVCIHENNLDSFNEFFSLAKKDGSELLANTHTSPEILLYEILNKLIISSYDILDENSVSLHEIESIIFDDQQGRAVSEILLLKRNIINMRKMMLNHKDILKKLTVLQKNKEGEKQLKDNYQNLIEHSKTIWGILDSEKEMIEALENTNESMINFRITDIMKTLTIFSVIVFPLTLLAAVFGMNTIHGMPFINHPNGFWIIVSMMIFGSLLMVLFFQKKKWFK